jgi:hypothetical protein
LQGNLLLLGLVLLLDALCTVNGSVRPASVAEIRKVLVWGRDRDIRKEIQEGILLPPLLPETDVLGQSINLVQPVVKTLSAAQQQVFRTSASNTSPEHNGEYDTSPMSYVDSSLFRRSNSNAESTPSEIVAATKKFSVKSAVLDAHKTQPNKASKMEKNTENRKKYELKQDTTTEDTLDESEHERPSAVPPVWSHPLIADEISDPFAKLPSNEEYDRSSRYTHSILYGFNTDF